MSRSKLRFWESQNVSGNLVSILNFFMIVKDKEISFLSLQLTSWEKHRFWWITWSSISPCKRLKKYFSDSANCYYFVVAKRQFRVSCHINRVSFDPDQISDFRTGRGELRISRFLNTDVLSFIFLEFDEFQFSSTDMDLSRRDKITKCSEVSNFFHHLTCFHLDVFYVIGCSSSSPPTCSLLSSLILLILLDKNVRPST